uniref:G_PROTEIN_RECEP_F1_2 domain-containing protein n=1 Tax=Haemonchus contortus TaxID=6289 RepID=A0A7I4YN59_HAECO
MTETLAEMPHPVENLIATSIIFSIALLGIIFNVLALHTVRMNPALRSSFGLLCLSHCVANLGVMIVFMFWVTPMNLRQSGMATELPGKIFGQLIMFFWDVCVYTHLLISINRLIAISMPYRAKHVLEKNCTLCFIAVVWFIAFCHVIPYFWDSCYVVFDTQQWVWTFADTGCGYIISTYTDLYTGCTWCAVKIVLDCITATKLRASNKMTLQQPQGNSTTNPLRQSRRKVEVRFFCQAIVQSGIFLCGMISFYFICQFFTGRWADFITMTIPWESCHAIDGLVVILFHFRLSYLRWKQKDSRQDETRRYGTSRSEMKIAPVQH